ncbi:unnamed protein product [Prunus brigantina]
MLHDPKCRFDCPLATVRLHHADIFSSPQAGVVVVCKENPFINISFDP